MNKKLIGFCLVFLMAVAIIGPDLIRAEEPKEIKPQRRHLRQGIRQEAAHPV